MGGYPAGFPARLDKPGIRWGGGWQGGVSVVVVVVVVARVGEAAGLSRAPGLPAGCWPAGCNGRAQQALLLLLGLRLLMLMLMQ